MLKMRFGSPAPPIFATFLRDYGLLLFLLPAGWLGWAARSGHRPRVDCGDAAALLLLGVAVLGLLGLVALVGTASVILHPCPLVQVQPLPPTGDGP